MVVLDPGLHGGWKLRSGLPEYRSDNLGRCNRFFTSGDVEVIIGPDSSRERARYRRRAVVLELCNPIHRSVVAE